MTTAQYKLRDQSTVLGYIWSFLNPILMLSVLYIFFRNRIGEGIEHFAAYLLVGYVLYNHFAKTTSSALQVLVDQRFLTSHTIFPKEIIVISSVLSRSLELIISLGVSIFIGLIIGVPLYFSLLLSPVLILLLLVLILWVSLILAILNVFIRDIDYIYDVFLRVLFFITPIFYAKSYVSGFANLIIRLNPLTYVLDFGRGIIIYGTLPDFFTLAAVLGFQIILFVIALWFFRRLEPYILEFL
jgi:ABC-type polysaccharide/polyol phosphate export permease